MRDSAGSAGGCTQRVADKQDTSRSSDFGVSGSGTADHLRVARSAFDAAGRRKYFWGEGVEVAAGFIVKPWWSAFQRRPRDHVDGFASGDALTAKKA